MKKNLKGAKEKHPYVVVRTMMSWLRTMTSVIQIMNIYRHTYTPIHHVQLCWVFLSPQSTVFIDFIYRIYSVACSLVLTMPMPLD